MHDKQPNRDQISSPKAFSAPPRNLNRELIAQTITVLLNHFFTPDMDPALRDAVARDWLEDLSEFAASSVADAAKLWRRTETRRPTPADIRKLCVEMRPAQPPMAAIGDRRLTEYVEERNTAWKSAAAARERWAHDHGCANFGEALRLGLKSVERRGERGEYLGDDAIKSLGEVLAR